MIGWVLLGLACWLAVGFGIALLVGRMFRRRQAAERPNLRLLK